MLLEKLGLLPLQGLCQRRPLGFDTTWLLALFGRSSTPSCLTILIMLIVAAVGKVSFWLHSYLHAVLHRLVQAS